MGKRRIKRSDIARLASVSEATVSLALNGSPRVKLATRERIERIAGEAGYIPDRAARSLKHTGNPTKSTFDHVGFLVFGRSTMPLSNAYLLMLLGAEQAATAIRAQLVFARVDPEADRSRIRMLSQENVDGWLVTGAINDEEIQIINSWHLPFVVLGDKKSTIPSHHVYVDHEMAGRMAVEYLHRRGHERIAVLNGPQCFLYQQQVLRGYREAVSELTGSVDERLSFFLERDVEIMRKVEDAFSLPAPPTALILAEDFELTEEIAEILHFTKSKIRSQRDTVVIGMESSMRNDVAQPLITTFGNSLGEAGVKLLVDVGLGKDKPTHVVKISPVLHEPSTPSSSNGLSLSVLRNKR